MNVPRSSTHDAAMGSGGGDCEYNFKKTNTILLTCFLACWRAEDSIVLYCM